MKLSFGLKNRWRADALCVVSTLAIDASYGAEWGAATGTSAGTTIITRAVGATATTTAMTTTTTSGTTTATTTGYAAITTTQAPKARSSTSSYDRRKSRPRSHLACTGRRAGTDDFNMRRRVSSMKTARPANTRWRSNTRSRVSRLLSALKRCEVSHNAANVMRSRHLRNPVGAGNTPRHGVAASVGKAWTRQALSS